jgi:hypothetical protein
LTSFAFYVIDVNDNSAIRKHLETAKRSLNSTEKWKKNDTPVHEEMSPTGLPGVLQRIDVGLNAVFGAHFLLRASINDNM